MDSISQFYMASMLVSLMAGS